QQSTETIPYCEQLFYPRDHPVTQAWRDDLQGLQMIRCGLPDRDQGPGFSTNEEERQSPALASRGVAVGQRLLSQGSRWRSRLWLRHPKSSRTLASTGHPWYNTSLAP